jgi:membrane fusion protein (multidrug efflux system)
VQSKYLIAVVRTDNKVSILPVTVGDKIGSWWIIEEGLKPGDRVIAEGAQKVQDGTQINPKPYQPDSTSSTNSNRAVAQ